MRIVKKLRTAIKNPHKIPVYFSEMTFCQEDGNSIFKLEKFDIEMGSWMILPEKDLLKARHKRIIK